MKTCCFVFRCGGSRCLRVLLPVILLLLSLVSPEMLAQDQGRGSVHGRVQNQLTGRYLHNARVQVAGTPIQEFTNEYGQFRLNNVPAGERTIRVFYTGLDPFETTVTVEAGETAQLPVTLTSARRLEREDMEPETFELEELSVHARAVDGSSIAINEQRFAGNIQNVVTADEFGDVTEGNVGEFLKFLPGISVEYVAADIRAISVRGLGDSQTVVTFDGNSMASAASGSATRRFELEQVSINNVARIELVKVPTPDMRADTLGGVVNMVSKSAFEMDRAVLNYRAYASLNSEDLTFGSTGGPKTGDSRKIRPGFDFSYLNPVSDDFGFVINGLWSDQFNEQHRSFRTWRSDDDADDDEPGNPAISASNPYLQDYTFQDGPKETLRQSLGINLDWRPAPDWVVSYGLQWNYYDSFFGNRNLRWRIDRSSPFLPVSYSPNHTHGPEGQGEVLHGNSFRNKHGRTWYSNVEVTYYGETITVEGSAFYSDGTGEYDDLENGHVERVQARARNVTVHFDEIHDTRPGNITTWNEDGSLFDHTDLSNYELLDIRSRPVRSSDIFSGGDFDITKDIGGPNSYVLKSGVSYRYQNREIFDPTYVWSFEGINGNDNADLILDDYYINKDPEFGLPPMEYPSPYYAYQLFRDNPEAFTPSAANARTEAERDIEVEERVSAVYLMGEGRFMDSRLRVISGVRWEDTSFNGVGPLSDGTTVIRKGATARGAYDDFFPSIHFTYDVTGNLLVRLAYARTISRPNWNFLIPRNVIDYDEEDGIENQNAGTLEAINGNLQPWFGDNFDLSVEYYTDNGGLFSAGVFYKRLSDMFESFSFQMTPELRAELGLENDPRFADPSQWTVETTVNGGDASITGFEFNVRQRLGVLGHWGNAFEAFANATLLDLGGDRNTDFSSFVERTANWGVTFTGGPVEVMLKWNYRGEQQIGPRSNEFDDGFRWYDDRLYLDVNLSYAFSERLILFCNARNITNEPQIRLNYNDLTPLYARQEQHEDYGVQIAVGVKGTF